MSAQPQSNPMDQEIEREHDRSLESAKPGEIIPFGTYPQTADGADRTPIKWRVLQNSGDELFVLSEYILECKWYHGEFVDITWRDCDLRQWLNDAFYHAAFNAAEQGFVKTTRCMDNGDGSPDTEDKIFLLSVAEVKEFTDAQDGDMRRRTIGTDYAKSKKADGCHLYVYDKGIEKDYILENGEKRGCSWWWTRSQSPRQIDNLSRVVFIGARSNIKTYGKVDIRFYGVRPAIKLIRQ
jgi:hypothetical protein